MIRLINYVKSFNRNQNGKCSSKYLFRFPKVPVKQYKLKFTDSYGQLYKFLTFYNLSEWSDKYIFLYKNVVYQNHPGSNLPNFMNELRISWGSFTWNVFFPNEGYNNYEKELSNVWWFFLGFFVCLFVCLFVLK